MILQVLVDASGNVYITDNGNHVIRKISGGVIQTIAGKGAVGYTGDNGDALQAELSSFIVGITVDAMGNIYFADSENNVVREIEASTRMITTVAGNGKALYSGDGGLALQAKLSSPLGVAVDSEGNLYIVDSQNGVIRMVTK
jgi:streptogramin lyase